VDLVDSISSGSAAPIIERDRRAKRPENGIPA
jgi:hypothetical protein